MATEDDAPAQEERAMAAAAGAAANESATLWARQARTAIQGSHSLTEPLARWTPEPVKRPAADPPVDADTALSPEFAIPAPVLRPRRPQRLSDDTICRSPIAGLVVAVMAAAGERVAVHQPVLVIEAMKMQNQVTAKVDGEVKVMHVATGDAVRPGQLLFEITEAS